MIKIIALLLLAIGISGNQSYDGGDVVEDNTGDAGFVEVTLDESSIPPNTETLTFTVTNHYESHELLGGTHYTLEHEVNGTWEDVTPVDAFNDIGYTIQPGGTHEFTHMLGASATETLEIGNYRILKDFYLVDGSETVISEDSKEVQVVVEFEVVE